MKFAGVRLTKFTKPYQSYSNAHLCELCVELCIDDVTMFIALDCRRLWCARRPQLSPAPGHLREVCHVSSAKAPYGSTDPW